MKEWQHIKGLKEESNLEAGRLKETLLQRTWDHEGYRGFFESRVTKLYTFSKRFAESLVNEVNGGILSRTAICG